MINRSFNTKTQKLYQFLLFLFCLFHCGMIVGQERLTNFPTVYINTENNASISSKENYVNASVVVKSADSSEEITKTARIRGRGNSTWGMPKKPYRLKFDEKTRFLNLNAEEKDWVLLANYADKTLIRNAVAFKISELVGMEFSPAARFVDVVVNGTKLGCYMVTDQMEVGKRRVPVQSQSTESTKLPEISGGYLLEIDGFADGEPVKFYTEKGLKITVKYPKDDEINPEQLEYISNFTQEFENRLFSENFTDPTEGYRAFVDINSLINWYIACELTGNSDSFWSTYIYKYKNIDKLYFGPLWDYDIAFNNDNRLGDATEKLMREHAHEPAKAWIRQIWKDDWFKKAVHSRWMELINEKNIQSTLTDYINELATLIDLSQQQNFQMWDILDTRVHLEQYLFSTYQEGVDYLISYLNNRIDFLTKSFENSLPNGPFVAGNYYYTITNENTGLAIQVENQSKVANAKLVLWEPLQDNANQQWIFKPLEGDKFQIINRNSNLALSGTGNMDGLTQSSLNETNERQQWHIIPLSTKSVYGIKNQRSSYSIDNAWGSSENGTSAIEYYDEMLNNSNQQWHIQPVEKIIKDDTNLPLANNDELKLHFNPTTSRLYIGLPSGMGQHTTVEIYSIEGKCLYRNDFVSSNEIEIPFSEQPIQQGVYIVKVINDAQTIVKKIIIKTS